MPFDGVVAKFAAIELNKMIGGGRIEKIHQPESDELLILVRANGVNYKLLLSANAAVPRIHLTETSRENPAVPSGFCMLLRKHLTGGWISSVECNDYERVIFINIEAVNELGDPSPKKLIIEIMGKYSNIILVNNSNVIMDAIKHVDFSISGVREVMPARVYMAPPGQDKVNPENATVSDILRTPEGSAPTVQKAILNGLKGFSPLLTRELSLRAGINPETKLSLLTDAETGALEMETSRLAAELKSGCVSPCVIYTDERHEKLMDFHCLEIRKIGYPVKHDTISEVIDIFHEESSKVDRQKQKKSSLMKVLTNAIDRCARRISLQEAKLRDTADFERLKLFGELLTANIYSLKSPAAKVSLHNYYSENPDEKVEIDLDEALSAQANAQIYFKKYAKAKRSRAAAAIQTEAAQSELEYLESVLWTLENAETQPDISEVRRELADAGYISQEIVKNGRKQKVIPSLPLEFTSSEGYVIHVGRNNAQNDRLTLKSSAGGDMWLHAHNIPGSHVIIVRKGPEFSDRVIYEAACLAAGHSKAKMSGNVSVDHTLVKYVKKPSGAKPGKVIYTNFKTVNATPARDIKEVR